jgi:hypothetical protein
MSLHPTGQVAWGDDLQQDCFQLLQQQMVGAGFEQSTTLLLKQPLVSLCQQVSFSLVCLLACAAALLCSHAAVAVNHSTNRLRPVASAAWPQQQ